MPPGCFAIRTKGKAFQMYTSINFPTKAALRHAVAEKRDVGVWQPNDMLGNPKASPSYSGPADVEGPHYPKPHRWYARVEVVQGKVVRVQ